MAFRKWHNFQGLSFLINKMSNNSNYLIGFVLAALCSMRDLSFVNQVLKPHPLQWKHSLSHWTTREVPPHRLPESESHSFVSDSLQPHWLYSPWNYPGQNTGVCSLFPSPGDVPNPWIELRSPAQQADSFPAESRGKPKNTGVGSLSFSMGSSWPKNRTRVSCIADGFCTSWATREAHKLLKELKWDTLSKIFNLTH